MTEKTTQVTIGDEILDLAAIAGVDMSEVQEIRTMALPAGQYLFKVLDAKLESREVTKDDEKVNKPVVDFELEVNDCMALVDDKLDPASVVGRKHHNSFWISDLAMDLGRAKAFMSDIGVESAGSLADLLTESHGIEFVSDVTNTKNKDNPDIIYANLKNTMTITAFQKKNTSE